LEATNLVTAAATLLIAMLVARELLRLRRGFPPVALALTAFFLALAADRVAAPDPFLGYSVLADAVTDVALLLLLALLLTHARRLARSLLATLDEARWRGEEYARARHDYSQLVTHRIANPLAAIKGAAHTLERDDIPGTIRRELLQEILKAAERVEHLSLTPERAGDEERELNAIPRQFVIEDPHD